jgi:hypothetical protein
LIGCGQNKTVVIMEDFENIINNSPLLLHLFSSSASSKPGLLFNQTLNMFEDSTSGGDGDKHSQDVLNTLKNEQIKSFPEFGFRYSFSTSDSPSGNNECFSSLATLFEESNSQHNSSENIFSNQLQVQSQTEIDKDLAYYSLLNRTLLNKSKAPKFTSVYSDKKRTLAASNPSLYQQTSSKTTIVNINSKLLHSVGSKHRFRSFN